MILTREKAARATRLNRVWSRKLGWHLRYEQISELLGFYEHSPGEEEFSEAIAQWQRDHRPLVDDGIIGPQTWRRMKPLTMHCVDRAGISRPEWLRKAPDPRPERPRRSASSPSFLWVGMAANYGGHFFLIGKDTTHGCVLSLDDYETGFVYTGESWRAGPGLGGSCGLSLVIISGVRDPTEMDLHTDEGADFQLALGSRLSDVAKAARKLPSVQRAIQKLSEMKKLQAAARSKLGRTALKLSLEDWTDIRSRILELLDAVGLERGSTKVEIATVEIPLPFPSGLEASAYWGFTNFRLESQWKTGP